MPTLGKVDFRSRWAGATQERPAECLPCLVPSSPHGMSRVPASCPGFLKSGRLSFPERCWVLSRVPRNVLVPHFRCVSCWGCRVRGLLGREGPPGAQEGRVPNPAAAFSARVVPKRPGGHRPLAEKVSIADHWVAGGPCALCAQPLAPVTLESGFQRLLAPAPSVLNLLAHPSPVHSLGVLVPRGCRRGHPSWAGATACQFFAGVSMSSPTHWPVQGWLLVGHTAAPLWDLGSHLLVCPLNSCQQYRQTPCSAALLPPHMQGTQ